MGNVAAAISVDVSLECDAWAGGCAGAEDLAKAAALAALGVVRDAAFAPETHLILGIILTDDAEQQELNRIYRGKDAPTNVLSFALADPAARTPGGALVLGAQVLDAPVLLGDVVLAFETVAREAAEQRKPVADHLRHLVVHGVLHLLGFDHERAADASVMEAHEIAILRGLGVPDPYRDTM